jgi:hypothetical protein
MRWGMVRPGGGGSSDGWFRIGSLEFTTVVLVVALAIVSVVEWAFEGSLGPVQSHLILDPGEVLDGQVWRLVTWPIAYPAGIGFFDIFAIFLFWYFGTEIESLLGKKKMAWFLALVTVGLGLLWVAFVEGTSISNGTASDAFSLSTLSQLQLMVLLVFIAEYPRRRFFFNIPGWVIGAVIVALYVIDYLGARAWLLLVNFLLGLVLTALIARAFGLLSEISWLPRLAVHRGPRRARRSSKWGSRPATGPTVVPGPWQPPPTPPVSKDQAALDALLDKISATGMDSLTDHERDQLLVLRDRLRRK